MYSKQHYQREQRSLYPTTPITPQPLRSHPPSGPTSSYQTPMIPCPHRFSSPYIEQPLTSLPDLEAERSYLLLSLQREDFATTVVLATVGTINRKLDSPIPLPPHEAKHLRKTLKVKRGQVERCMRQEKWILNRLGHVAFQIQCAQRHERIQWHLNGGAGSSCLGGMDNGVMMGREIQPSLGQFGIADQGYATFNEATPPLSTWPTRIGAQDERQRQRLPSDAFQWQHSSGQQAWHAAPAVYGDIARRDTVMVPPNSPSPASRPTIVAPNTHAESRSNLTQLPISSSETYLPCQQGTGRIGGYRKSEPGLLLEWDNRNAGYVDEQCAITFPAWLRQLGL